MMRTASMDPRPVTISQPRSFLQRSPSSPSSVPPNFRHVERSPSPRPLEGYDFLGCGPMDQGFFLCGPQGAFGPECVPGPFRGKEDGGRGGCCCCCIAAMLVLAVLCGLMGGVAGYLAMTGHSFLQAPIRYETLSFGVTGCPPGSEITSMTKCVEAVESLGLQGGPAWAGADPEYPKFCSVRADGSGQPGWPRVHWNTAQDGRGRPDLAPVCKEVAEYQMLPAGSRGCQPGLEITTQFACEEAINSLGMISQPAWVGEDSSYPYGCSVKIGGPLFMHWNSLDIGRERFDLAPVCKKEGLIAAPSYVHTVQLILARYHEDLSWAEDQAASILVINRGNPVNLPGVQEVMMRQNVGREAYVYLWYILRHYDNLPSLMAFCQADPEYEGNTKAILLNDVHRLEAVMIDDGQTLNGETPLNPRWQEIETQIRQDGFSYLGTQRGPSEGNDPDWDALCHAFAQHFPGCAFKDLRYVPGGCIAVTRDAVRAKPPEWYGSWLDLVSTENNPLEGFVIERAWACIFLDPGGESAQCSCPPAAAAAPVAAAQ